MSGFWLASAVLTLIALGFLAVPLWREWRRSGQWSVGPLAAAFLLVPVAFGLYFQVRTWAPAPPAGSSPAEQMVAQLAARLKQSPDDPTGWRMLGKSYLVLGDPVRARDAYREAWSRSPDHDNDLKLSLAEAEAQADRSSLKGEAGKLVEEVLASEPTNPRALWYGGFAAYDQGNEALARTRWTALLATNPPDEIKSVLAQFGVTAPASAAPAVAGSLSAENAGGTATAGATGPVIKLNVKLGTGVSTASLGPNASLFIFARAPGGGPPVAVIRQPISAVPGVFTLSDANSMIPGRSLKDFPQLTVVARLSASGQPIQQPGDLYAEAQVAPGATADLVIDQVAK
jgi:cytochrome c-type biogenesis protein CcmH